MLGFDEFGVWTELFMAFSTPPLQVDLTEVANVVLPLEKWRT